MLAVCLGLYLQRQLPHKGVPVHSGAIISGIVVAFLNSQARGLFLNLLELLLHRRQFLLGERVPRRLGLSIIIGRQCQALFRLLAEVLPPGFVAVIYLTPGRDGGIETRRFVVAVQKIQIDAVIIVIIPDCAVRLAVHSHRSEPFLQHPGIEQDNHQHHGDQHDVKGADQFGLILHRNTSWMISWSGVAATAFGASYHSPPSFSTGKAEGPPQTAALPLSCLGEHCR